jgi:hypothetical protein
MNLLRGIWMKMCSAFLSLKSHLSYQEIRKDFRRYPLDYYILTLFSWLALIEIVIVILWFFVQVIRIDKENIVSETFHDDNLRVHVYFPVYVGEGDQGSLKISVENFCETSLEVVNVYILEDKGEYVWFPEGNQVEFKGIKQDEQQYGEISYVVGDSIPKDIKSFRYTVVIYYRDVIEEKDDLQKIVALPLIREQFSVVAEMQVDDFKGDLLSVNHGFESGFKGLSTIKDLIGFIVAILAGIIALKTNIFEILNGKKA